MNDKDPGNQWCPEKTLSQRIRQIRNQWINLGERQQGMLENLILSAEHLEERVAQSETVDFSSMNLESPATLSAGVALSKSEEDAIASGHGRPATLAEALAILKSVHKLSPAEQRDIDEAIRCIVAFDGITDEMVEQAIAAAHEDLRTGGGVMIDTRRHWAASDRSAMKAALEAVIESAKPPRSAIERSEERTLLEAALCVMEQWDEGLDEQDGREYENACKDWADCLAALREWKKIATAGHTGVQNG